MDYEQKYKKALERAKIFKGHLLEIDEKDYADEMEYIFPELKESKDERIRKELIKETKGSEVRLFETVTNDEFVAWLEKQSDTNETINNDELAQSVLRGAAINLITWIDYNAAEGNMCLSNVQCREIENALVSGNWNKIYAYMKKKLEKQGEQKPTIRERYENIAKSDWFKKTHEGMSITIPDNLVGTDTDGGVVGEKGEQGETPFKEHMENLKKRIEDNQFGCIVQRLDKIIELLQSAILIFPKEPYVPPITYTTANTFGSDYDIDTDKIK